MVDKLQDAQLNATLRIDLGEIRRHAYYTGVSVSFLATGPGEPIGMGGRYDQLLGRYGASHPATGFAFDVDALEWALRDAGVDLQSTLSARVAIGGGTSNSRMKVANKLREQLICAVTLDQKEHADAKHFARAWAYDALLWSDRTQWRATRLSDGKSRMVTSEQFQWCRTWGMGNKRGARMTAVVVVGAQWGDEGKGKIVDLYSPYAELVVRFAGGANAGHTLVVGGKKLILRLIPSGILHETATCLIGQGTVIDPNDVLGEIDALRERGVKLDGRLFVSERAHVVLPQHKLVDGLREQGKNAIGTTKRGIGPTYQDKAARRGLRIGDLADKENLRAKVQRNIDGWESEMRAAGTELPNVEEIVDHYHEMGTRLAPFVSNTTAMLAAALSEGKNVLLEGAQGTMLDIDHGTYPFVTSSNAVAGGACAGAGIGPSRIGRVIGIGKAYTTRVGNGPFPAELDDAVGKHLQDTGAEFGSVTGRPRRCGWLDLVVLRHAAQVNGLDEIALTKLDVLTGLKELKLCIAYELDGQRHEVPPFDGLDRVKPIYETLPGWSEDIQGCRSRNALPQAALNYIDLIEKSTGCAIGIISVGPDREATAELNNPFSA